MLKITEKQAIELLKDSSFSLKIFRSNGGWVVHLKNFKSLFVVVSVRDSSVLVYKSLDTIVKKYDVQSFQGVL